jgi:signal transduction histidine kinase
MLACNNLLLTGIVVAVLTYLHYYQNTSELFLAIVLTGFVLLIVNVLMAYILIQPVNRLIAMTKEIGHKKYKMLQDFSALAKQFKSLTKEIKKMPTEFATIAKMLNQFAFKINREELVKKQFIEDVSHEIKTPLSSLRGFIEGINDGVIEPSEKNCLAMIQQIDRLGQLVDDLDYSLESSLLNSKLAPVFLSELIKRINNQYEAMCQSYDLNYIFKNQVTADTEILADLNGLDQVFINLLNNSYKFTPRQGSFALLVKEENGYIEFVVADSGQGIAKRDRPFVFERLYKGDRSRARKAAYEGSGLGLFIAKMIIEYHGGKIKVAESPYFHCGTSMLIQIPKHQGH